MKRIMKKIVLIIQCIAVLIVVSVGLIACSSSELSGPEVSDNDIPAPVVSDNTDDIVSADNVASEEEDVLTEEELALFEEYRTSLGKNARYYKGLVTNFAPSGTAGEIFEGYSRDIFFANGTPISILPPNADVEGCVHDEKLQESLGNGLGPDNRGYGATIFWVDGSEKKYVMVSNMAQVYGGSYKSGLIGDIYIVLDGSEAKESFPNISYLFGGSMDGNIVGNINIYVSDARPMYLFGGSYNGNVYGNVDIEYEGSSWSLEVVGGGLTVPDETDEMSLVWGDVNMRILGKNSTNINCITGGGVAITDTENVGISDICGNVELSISDQKVYEICGGGMAIKSASDNGAASANVYGNVKVNVDNTNILYDESGSVVKSGVICGGGMSQSGLALVFGSSEINVGRLKLDPKAVGLYAGGLCNYKYGIPSSSVYGDATIVLDNERANYRITECEQVALDRAPVKDAFAEGFSHLQKPYRPDLITDMSEEVIGYINVYDIEEKYSQYIIPFLKNEKLDGIVRGELATNMTNILFLKLEDKGKRQSTEPELYFPNPSTSYMWSY